MRTFAPIKIKLYPPETDTDKKALEQQVAEVHADAVIKQLQDMALPAVQRLDIVDCLIAASKN